ncbi:hypothetical protein RNI52_27785 [Labrys neptuniae]|uniref:hypothetical protein n=1 Tax=Labrys neptuniae TaxID=376174 RepID=UPI00288D9A86|nr:hypothetical protein [Labrys neptuniae]MDT3381159.1 hypothetical protein [Labrys neptuniae]
MAEETRTGPTSSTPSNDNSGLAGSSHAGEIIDPAKLDRIVLDIARAIGRQLARGAFDKHRAANDNRPSRRKEEGRGKKAEPPLGKREVDPP